MASMNTHNLDSYADVLTVEDVGNILHIGKKLVYRMIHENELPARRIGRIYRISKKELINYLSMGN